MKKEWTTAVPIVGAYHPLGRTWNLSCEYGWWDENGQNTFPRHDACRTDATWARGDDIEGLIGYHERDADGACRIHARFLCDEHLSTHYKPIDPIQNVLREALLRLERI